MNFFDKKLNKLFSRKLFVFLIACFFLGFDKLSGGDWIVIACIYLGAQAALDFYSQYKT